MLMFYHTDLARHLAYLSHIRSPVVMKTCNRSIWGHRLINEYGSLFMFYATIYFY